MTAEKRIVFVEVDDTLVRSIGTKRIPMPPAVERVKRLRGKGAMLDLSSRGGANYARESAEELGVP